MEQRGFDPSFSDVDDETAGCSRRARCKQAVVQLRKGEPICYVDELVSLIAWNVSE